MRALMQIMDQALADIAERLEVPMPYLRGGANDRRTAGDFVGRLASRAKQSFYKREIVQQGKAPTYSKHSAATSALEVITPQLAVWANRGTHTFSASSNEAGALIDNCEAALKTIECTCGTPVYYSAIEATDRLQCQCGELQWRM
jgi:hypothetical protein